MTMFSRCDWPNQPPEVHPGTYHRNDSRQNVRYLGQMITCDCMCMSPGNPQHTPPIYIQRKQIPLLVRHTTSHSTAGTSPANSKVSRILHRAISAASWTFNSSLGPMSQKCSKGYKCCIAHSKCDFSTLTFTALLCTISAGKYFLRHTYFHFPLFFSSPLMIIILCLYLRAPRYSLVHLAHAAFLHFRTYLQLTSSTSSFKGFIGIAFNIIFGVSTGY